MVKVPRVKAPLTPPNKHDSSLSSDSDNNEIGKIKKSVDGTNNIIIDCVMIVNIICRCIKKETS